MRFVRNLTHISHKSLVLVNENSPSQLGSVALCNLEETVFIVDCSIDLKWE